MLEISHLRARLQRAAKTQVDVFLRFALQTGLI
jgi:hypothetical protein